MPKDLLTMSGFGAFGKIPALGDFFHVGLSRDFIEPWDSWLQTTLTHGRDTFADSWDENYMSAPIWRFTLSSGLAGPAAMLGVLMVSVDRVGRKFPLTLAAPLRTVGNVEIIHKSATNLFEALENAALDALEDDMTKSALSESLSYLPSFIPPSGATLLKRSIWSAILDGRHFHFQSPTLPNARQASALFNPLSQLSGAPV